MNSKINPDLMSLARDISTLHEDPKNARKHAPGDLAVIAASLDKHGQQKTIIATSDGKVIAGNGTLAAARDNLKWTHIACITFDSEDEAKQAAFAIVDNRSAELSSWDFDELASIINDLPDDFSDDLGFSEKELAAISTMQDDNLKAASSVTKDVNFKATVTGDTKPANGGTAEVKDLGEAKQQCPKCGFQYDG